MIDEQALQAMAAERHTSKIRKHMNSMAHRDHTNKTRLPEELLALLGCPHLRTADGGGLTVPPLPKAHIAEIGEALLKITSLVASSLAEPVCDAASVLSGLWRSHCWALCLREESTTYAMAAVLLEFLQGYSSIYRLDNYAGPDVCNLLNAWLKQPSPWTDLPSSADVAEHLFGAGWCMLRLPSAERALGELVYQERPPFLPGLCPAQDVLQSAPLPADLGLAL